MPNFSAYLALVLIASCFISLSQRGLSTALDSKRLSIIPVSDTPSRRSSSVFLCHILRKYGILVKVDCTVPRIVASLTLRLRLSRSSLSRTTTSVRLQNWYGRRIISEHGLVPHSCPVSRLPFFSTCLSAATRLKIPRSPDLLSTRANHSRMNVSMSGFSVYAAELLASARCPSFSHHEPDLA